MARDRIIVVDRNDQVIGSKYRDELVSEVRTHPETYVPMMSIELKIIGYI